MHGMVHVSAGTLKDWKGLQLTKEIFIDRKPGAYELRTGEGSKAACQMTKRECYTLWGVPMDDDDEDGDGKTGSKRKLEPEGGK